MHDVRPFPADEIVPAPTIEREEKRTIRLSDRFDYEAIVDEEDYHFLIQWRWTFLRSKRSKSVYARRGGGRHNGGKSEKVTPTILMHVVVCERAHGPRPSVLHTPDHKNGKTLDNRRENLRWATPEQQTANRRGGRK